MKPYYDRDGITLYVGDALDLLPNLDIEGAAVVTDPPYNAGKNYGKTTNDRQEWPEWAAWLDERFDAWAAAPETFMFLSQTAYRQYVRHGQLELEAAP